VWYWVVLAMNESGLPVQGSPVR